MLFVALHDDTIAADFILFFDFASISILSLPPLLRLSFDLLFADAIADALYDTHFSDIFAADAAARYCFSFRPLSFMI